MLTSSVWCCSFTGQARGGSETKPHSSTALQKSVVTSLAVLSGSCAWVTILAEQNYASFGSSKYFRRVFSVFVSLEGPVLIQLRQLNPVNEEG